MCCVSLQLCAQGQNITCLPVHMLGEIKFKNSSKLWDKYEKCRKTRFKPLSHWKCQEKASKCPFHVVQKCFTNCALCPCEISWCCVTLRTFPWTLRKCSLSCMGPFMLRMSRQLEGRRPWTHKRSRDKYVIHLTQSRHSVSTTAQDK